MMALLRPKLAPKNRLSATLKSWLPILQSGPLEMEEVLQAYAKDNPCMRVQSGLSADFSACQFHKAQRPNAPTLKNTMTDKIESLSVREATLYETLHQQLLPPLFPTQTSLQIAQDIIENLNHEGYFEGDVESLALKLGVHAQDYEKVRQRFAYLDPPGVGARDLQESFFFQLAQHNQLDDSTYSLCVQILANLSAHKDFSHLASYKQAMKIITSFKNPPALDFHDPSPVVIPDLLILEQGGEISVQLNDSYYPQVVVEEPKIKQANDYLKEKLKEARDLVDALQMRQQTILKIGLMLVEYQYDFFKGKQIKPMRLVDIANEFGYAPSTISRAISNKYLECARGIFPIKSFFTTALEGDISNASIKDFILDRIAHEDPLKPLSDLKILELVEAEFHLKMVRRTITKYRKLLNIASSAERKKLYELRAKH